MIKKLLLPLFVLFTIKALPQGAPACPSISPTATPPSFCQGNCTDLNATVVSNQQTTSYSVSSIPYAPYPYAGGTGVSVGTDDVWSPTMNLGFTFCYFGTPYTQAVVGSNGHLTFDLSYSSGYDSYPVTTPLPSTANMPANTICAVFRDIDPSVSGNCKYYTTGTAPCRALVIYWNNIALYSCGTPHSTFQMVLYENTNYIDVYIQNSAGTCAWENGNGIVGIMNAAGTVAVCPPGRNCTNFTANNEAWRFTPTGAPSYNVTWTGPSGVVGTGLGPVNVCPTTNTTYTATMNVTDCNGASTSYTNTVAVTVTPGPSITVNTPPAICGGAGGATLNASGGTTYSWTPATGLSATTGASVTANPGSTTTYTVTGSTAGCSGTAVVTVTVSPNPTITVNSPVMCGSGGTTTLTANGGTTYSWTPSGDLSSSTGATVTSSATATTVYTVTGDLNGCTGTATATVTVGPGITPTVNSATICSGNSTTLTAGGATTYTWSPATGLSATTGASVTANPVVTTTYTVTATSGACTGTVTSVVTVDPTPTVTVNSATMCAGDPSPTLTANGATTYNWSPGTGLSATTGASVTANPPTTTVYTITGTSASCTSTATSTVTVNPLPTVTVNSGFVCNGSATTLTANGASTYTWSPATGLSSTNGASVTGNPPSTTQYTVTGTDANGCIDSDTTSITVVNNPTVTVTTATICVGQQTATLTANGAATYVWSPAGGLSSTTGSTVTATPGTTTVYTVTGSAGTCTSVATTTVTVNPLPAVAVNSATICVGQQTATLTANGATSYSWNPGTGLSGTTGASVTGTPTTTTNYTITGTDGNGCFSTATSTIVVNPLPNVTVNSGLICLGGSMALNANGATNYAWAPPGGLSATTGANVNANPAATTVYTVTGTDANGCVTPASSTVTVVSNPTITVSTGTICVGQQTATLTANGGTTYAWSPATGLSATTGSTVTANPNATTTYTITGTVGTCTATGTTTVTVNPLPNITAASNSPVCVNQSLNLTAANGVSYGWMGPNTFTSTASNPTIPGVSIAAAGIYTLTGTDANGCINMNTVNVIINPLPVVTATGATVCLNAPINLSCTPNNAPGYSWSGPLVYSSSSQTPTIASATSGMAGNYVVTVTDANGCVNASVAIVAVNSLPVVTANSGTVCLGQTTAVLNAAGANTYNWTPVTGLNSSTGASVTANPAATCTYVVTGTDVNGCQSSATVTVTVNPAPTVVISPQNVSGCAPICPTFSNTTASSGNFNWNFGDGSNSQQSNPNHCYLVQGTYSVSLTLTDANGCINSGSAQVNVYPVPKADFTMNPQPTTILDPNIQFYDLSTGAVIVGWNWTFGDYGATSSSILQNPDHMYADTGYYATQLVVVSNYGCKDSTIKMIRIDDDYSLYVPNAFSPNSDGTNDVFRAVGFGVKDFKLFIFDRWGNQLFFSDKLETGWDGRYQAKGDDIVQEDVYVWKIETKTVKNERKILAGTVSLLK